MGYQVLATPGTAEALSNSDIECTPIRKIKEGHPNLLDFLTDGDVALVMNTPMGKGARTTKAASALRLWRRACLA